MIKYTITQLPTRSDKTRQIATTKEKYIYGPATVMLEEHEDGSRHQVEFDYTPDASPEVLVAMWNAKFGVCSPMPDPGSDAAR